MLITKHTHNGYRFKKKKNKLTTMMKTCKYYADMCMCCLKLIKIPIVLFVQNLKKHVCLLAFFILLSLSKSVN